MIHKNIWKPDTCSCEVEFEWDDALPEADRTHTISKIVKRCPEHAAHFSDAAGAQSKLWEENKRKNTTLKTLMEEVAETTSEVMQPDGKIRKILKDGIKFNWSYDSERNLLVDVQGLTKAQEDSLKSLTESKFGTKVKING